VTSIIGRRETTGTAPNPNCINGHTSGAPGAAGVICDAVEAAGGVGHPFWRRASQAVVYQSPVFSGVQLKALYQTNESKATGATLVGNGGGTTTADPSLWSASVQWAGMGGRARVGAAFDRHKDFTTAGKSDTGWAVKGGWNFGVVDVGLAYERMTYKAVNSDCRAKQYAVALAVPVGTGTIRASYSVAKDIEGDFTVPAPAVPAGTAFGPSTCGGTVTGTGGPGQPAAVNAAGNTGAKQYNIGYEHRFSKRTNVGIGYAAIKNDPGAVFTWTGAPPTSDGANNTPFAGQDPSTYFVSITHRF
jgi:predicted porin